MIDYDPHHWFRHLLDIKGSMVREIGGRVLTCVAWSACVVAFHKWVHPVSVPSTVHGLVGVALGLLLVFRTNASYDRFWEGRKMWGGMVNETRNLARLATALLRDAPELQTAIIRWTTTLPYAVMHSLRHTGPDLGPAVRRLDKDEVARVLGAQHVPLAVATQLSRLIDDARRQGKIGEIQQMGLDQNVQLLVDYLGACERIHKTPLPFAYVVHLRRALVLYCFTLPFALLEPFGWGAVIDTLFVAYTFFGIEEIGVEIEDPFGVDDNDLPLERISDTIHANLTALLPESEPRV